LIVQGVAPTVLLIAVVGPHQPNSLLVLILNNQCSCCCYQYFTVNCKRVLCHAYGPLHAKYILVRELCALFYLFDCNLAFLKIQLLPQFTIDL
jgi:hypothetical protein